MGIRRGGRNEKKRQANWWRRSAPRSKVTVFEIVGIASPERVGVAPLSPTQTSLRSESAFNSPKTSARKSLCSTSSLPGAALAVRKLELTTYFNAHKAESFLLLSIDAEEKQDRVDAFLTGLKIDFPASVDAGPIQKQYGISAFPTAVLREPTQFCNQVKSATKPLGYGQGNLWLSATAYKDLMGSNFRTFLGSSKHLGLTLGRFEEERDASRFGQCEISSNARPLVRSPKIPIDRITMSMLAAMNAKTPRVPNL